MSWCFAEMVTLGFWADISKAVEQDPVTGVSLYVDRICFGFVIITSQVFQQKDQIVSSAVYICTFLCAVFICHLYLFYNCSVLFSVVHRSLFSAKQRSPGKHQNTSGAQQAVVRQRLEHAELCGFKPIDSPASAMAGVSSKRKTTGSSNHKASSESSSNPLSGDEYY